MSAQGHAGTTAIVTGASRGFGRGIAAALTRAGVKRLGPPLTPEQAGRSTAGITAGPDTPEPPIASPPKGCNRSRDQGLLAGNPGAHRLQEST